MKFKKQIFQKFSYTKDIVEKYPREDDIYENNIIIG